MKNPFKIVDLGDGPIQEPIAEDTIVRFDDSEFETLVCVEERVEPGGGRPLLRFGGLWVPAEGTEIELLDPPRRARIVGQRYQLGHGKIVSLVFVRDPETQEGPWLVSS